MNKKSWANVPTSVDDDDAATSVVINDLSLLYFVLCSQGTKERIEPSLTMGKGHSKDARKRGARSAGITSNPSASGELSPASDTNVTVDGSDAVTCLLSRAQQAEEFTRCALCSEDLGTAHELFVAMSAEGECCVLGGREHFLSSQQQQQQEHKLQEEDDGGVSSPSFLAWQQGRSSLLDVSSCCFACSHCRAVLCDFCGRVVEKVLSKCCVWRCDQAKLQKCRAKGESKKSSSVAEIDGESFADSADNGGGDRRLAHCPSCHPRVRKASEKHLKEQVLLILEFKQKKRECSQSHQHASAAGGGADWGYGGVYFEVDQGNDSFLMVDTDETKASKSIRRLVVKNQKLFGGRTDVINLLLEELAVNENQAEKWFEVGECMYPTQRVALPTTGTATTTATTSGSRAALLTRVDCFAKALNLDPTKMVHFTRLMSEMSRSDRVPFFNRGSCNKRSKAVDVGKDKGNSNIGKESTNNEVLCSSRDLAVHVVASRPNSAAAWRNLGTLMDWDDEAVIPLPTDDPRHSALPNANTPASSGGNAIEDDGSTDVSKLHSPEGTVLKRARKLCALQRSINLVEAGDGDPDSRSAWYAAAFACRPEDSLRIPTTAFSRPAQETLLLRQEFCFESEGGILMPRAEILRMLLDEKAEATGSSDEELLDDLINRLLGPQMMVFMVSELGVLFPEHPLVARYTSLFEVDRSRQIGAGAYGQVYLASRRLKPASSGGRGGGSRRVRYAAKEMVLDGEASVEGSIRKNAELTLITYHGLAEAITHAVYATVDRKRNTMTIFLEYARFGSASSYLDNQIKGRLHESELMVFFAQCLDAVALLHHHGVVHQDIKPANILVFDSNKVKLSDFGVSLLTQCSLHHGKKKRKQVKGDSETNSSSVPPSITSTAGAAGTELYMAPEVLNKRQVSFAADMWSLACTMIELASHRPPIVDPDFVQSPGAMHPFRPFIPQHLSQQLKSILGSCLDYDPSMRPTAAELSQHEYFANLELPADAELLEVYQEEGEDDDDVSTIGKEEEATGGAASKRVAGKERTGIPVDVENMERLSTMGLSTILAMRLDSTDQSEAEGTPTPTSPVVASE